MFIKVIKNNGIEHRTECMHYSVMDDTEDPLWAIFFAETDLNNRQTCRQIKVDKTDSEVYIESHLGKTIDIYRWKKTMRL